MFRKNLQSLYLLQVYASTTDNYLAEAIANFADIHDNGLLKGIVVILYYLAHVLFWVRIMKRRVRTVAMPFLLSVLVLCLSKHCMLVQLLREKVAALVF